MNALQAQHGMAQHQHPPLSASASGTAWHSISIPIHNIAYWRNKQHGMAQHGLIPPAARWNFGMRGRMAGGRKAGGRMADGRRQMRGGRGEVAVM